MRLRLSAGALYYSIGIAIVCAVLTLSLILYVGQQKKLFKSIEAKNSCRENVESGFQLLLSDFSDPGLAGGIELELFEGTAPILLKRSTWGIYEVLLVECTSRYAVTPKIALVGSPPSNTQVALSLFDRSSTLKVSGSNTIRGNVFVPKGRVETGYVSGSGFIGSSPVQGKVNEQNDLRIIPDRYQEIYKQLSPYSYQETDSIVDLSTAGLPNISTQSFKNRTVLLSSNQDLFIDNIDISGNIQIKCTGTVVLGSNASIADVIVSAPKVWILDGFTGGIQVYATDSIDISNNVHLTYPSALILNCRESFVKQPSILIGDNSVVEGDIILDGSDFKNKSYLRIAEEAKVLGVIRNTGITEHRGLLIGSLFTNELIVRTSSSIHSGFLYNATIDATKLPSYYAGAIEQGKKKQVVKWLR